MREKKPDLFPLKDKHSIKGFISIEFLIFIVIICLILFTGLAAFFFALGEARDKQRLADVTVIRSALQAYFDESGFYPLAESAQKPAGIANYLDRWPTPPPKDGSCNETSNQYAYSQKANGADFALTFCLGQKTDGVPAGVHLITSKLFQ